MTRIRKVVHDFYGLQLLLLGILFLYSSSVALIKNDLKVAIKPPASAILEELPVKPEKKASERLFFNECQECMKESRHWHYNVMEMEAIVGRCGADYLLVRYDRKFVDKDCDIIARFNFSYRKESMDLDSIEMLKRWENGDMHTWSQIVAASEAVSIPIPVPAGLNISTSKVSALDMKTIARHVSGFESKMTRTGDTIYRLHFRLDDRAWMATEKGIDEAEWPWKKSPQQKLLAGYMVGYSGETPSTEGACFNKQERGIVIRNLLVDYPLNQCRVSFEITSGSPLKKALFSTLRNIDSITFDGDKRVSVSKSLSVDTASHHVFLEISDIYGKTAIKRIAVYDQLRKYKAQRDTLRRLQRIKDSLAARSAAFRAVHFISKFDGNPFSSLIRDYFDDVARTAMRESGIVQFTPSAMDSLITLPFPGRPEFVRKVNKYFVQSQLRFAPCSPTSQKPSHLVPCISSRSIEGILSFTIPITENKYVPTIKAQSNEAVFAGQNVDSSACLLFSCFDANYTPGALEILSLPGQARISARMSFYVLFSSRDSKADSVTMIYIVKFADNEETLLHKMMKPSDLLKDQSFIFNDGTMNSKVLAYQMDSHHTIMVERNEVAALKNILKVDIFAFDNRSHQTIGVSSVWYVP